MEVPLSKGVKSARGASKRNLDKIFLLSSTSLILSLRLDKLVSFSVLQLPSLSARFLSLIDIIDKFFEVCKRRYILAAYSGLR